MTGHDEEFEDFLRRRRPVFGRPDDQLEPPEELDRIVLRQARAAIESDRPARVFRAPGWGMPVALAATLVLAFTIILRVETPKNLEPKGEVTVQAVSRQVETPVADVAAPAAAAAAAPAPAPNASPAESPALLARSADSNPVVELDAAEGAAESASIAPSAARERRFDKVADTAASPAAPPPLVSDDEATRYARPMASRSSAGDARASTGVVIDGQRAEVSGNGELRATTVAPAAPVAGYRKDTKTWLAEIDRLRAAGENARADAELAEFRREHRAYAVSPDR